MSESAKNVQRSDLQTGVRVLAASRERIRFISRALIISILIGTVMGIIEISLFAVTGNRALLTDGFVSILCFIPGMLSLISVRLGQRRADWRMNYGYRRVETLAVLIFSLAVCGFTVTQIVQALLYPPERLVIEYGPIIVGYAAGAIGIQILLSRYLWRVGKEMSSSLLRLDAMLLRGDIVISAIILAGGILLVASPSMVLLQTIVTLIVVLIIFAYGAKEAVTAARELIDANPSFQANILIERIAEENPAICFIAEQRIRSFGGALSVELTIEVEPGMTVQEAYAVSREVERRIRSEIDNIIDIRIRTNPAGAYIEAELENDAAFTDHTADAQPYRGGD